MTILRSRVVIVFVVVTLVVVMLWLVLFFTPRGKRLNSLETQEAGLQATNDRLQAQLAVLEKTQQSIPALHAMQALFNVAVPTSPNTSQYITIIENQTKLAGVALNSISIGGPSAPRNGVSSIPVSLSTHSNYDQMLQLITNLTTLPRLTVIISMSISGGGPGTDRNTALGVSYSLTIYTNSNPTPTT